MHFVDITKPENPEPTEGFERLLAALPANANDFAGSEYPQPAALAYFGEPLNVERLRRKAESIRLNGAAALCETAMAMAEAIESVAPDRERYFITDAKARQHVFTGSKWRAGWACLIGSADHAPAAAAFKERDFLVFAQRSAGQPDPGPREPAREYSFRGGEPGVVDLGPRETAAVYFFQLMVRYAMIWGMIPPGDAHEMGHFLENDLPGVVVADGPLTPVEELLLLALMKMGAPAVVPKDYPFDYGRFVRAEGTEAIVEAAAKFPNLRIKDVDGAVVSLPAYCNPANAGEKFEPARRVGGGDSFFVLRPAEAQEGVDLPPQDDLSRAGALAILVDVGDPRLDIAASDFLEKRALSMIGMIAGQRARQSSAGEFFVEAAADAPILASRLAGAIAAGLRFNFPFLERIHVRVVASADEAARLRPRIDAFRKQRRAALAAESDETAREFFYCIECQPFSHAHACIVTPDRWPMCGRDRQQVIANALFGAGINYHPWKRRDIQDVDLRAGIPAGTALDPLRGEYDSVNQAASRVTGRKIERVFLHSVRDYPHSNCGCFHFLAFWMEERQGIGVMERNYKRSAPGGRTWDQLANAAGGKQCPGLAGASPAYLRSPKFLQGDGGHAAIRWLSPKAFKIIQDLLPAPSRVEMGEE
ncbi:MAG: hypothetical protein NTW86_19365 [Candidatus Sumerlaeota bacterium]|nr:hypothetical protein [Candidatus Sumerlaeota bacterium]